MKKVKIKRNTNGDSRVAKNVPTIIDFAEANLSHIHDVKVMMYSLAEEIKIRGERHDWTKRQEPYESNFYRDLCNTIEGRIEFKDGQWNKDHYALERHHLQERCPDDVNLIDVLEMICDCVCAGMARSGKVRDFGITGGILIEAVKNTVEMCKEAIVLEEEE